MFLDQIGKCLRLQEFCSDVPYKIKTLRQSNLTYTNHNLSQTCKTDFLLA